MKKVILINILVFFILFCILEFISWVWLRNDAGEYLTRINEEAKKNKLPLYTQRYAPIKLFEKENQEDLRPINKGEKSKPSVLFFGCSYMYGHGYEDDKFTIPYIVWKKTGRTTINRAVSGGSILNTFNDLNNPEFYEEMNKLPQPDYIVYLWINDHLNRISNPYVSSVTTTEKSAYYINASWEEKDGKLIKHVPSRLLMPFYGLFCVRAYHCYFAQNFALEKKDEKMTRYFLIANKIFKEKFPNSQFVIIEYKDGGKDLMTDTLRNNLESNGIIVLNAEKLAGHELDSEKWRREDKEHPNDKAFYDVAEGLIKALNL